MITTSTKLLNLNSIQAGALVELLIESPFGYHETNEVVRMVIRNLRKKRISKTEIEGRSALMVTIALLAVREENLEFFNFSEKEAKEVANAAIEATNFIRVN